MINKIKNSLKVAGISTLTILGADKISAQDIVVSVEPKKQIEKTIANDGDTLRIYNDGTKDIRFSEPYPSSPNDYSARLKKLEDISLENSAKKDSIFLKDTKPHGYLKVNISKDSTTIKPKKRNYLYTSDPWAKAEDGISISTSLHNLIITPTTNTELDSIIYAKLGNDFYKVVNSKNATKNIIKFINKSGSLFGKTKEPMIQRYLERLKDINKINTLDDSVYNTSCKILTKALEDKVLESIADSLYDENGNCKITPGIYTLVSKNKGESLPIYLNIKTFKENNAVEFVDGFTGLLTGHNANDTTGQGKTAVAIFPTLQSANSQVFTKSINIFTESINKKMNEKAVEPVTQVKVNEYLLEEKIKKASKEKYTSVIVGAHGGQVNGVDLGIQHGNVAFLGNYSLGLYNNLETISGPESNTGMHGEARTNNSHWRAFGLSGEYNQNYIIGAGINRWGYDNEKEVRILNKDGIMKRKAEPIEYKSSISGKFYVGKNFKNNKIGLTINYDIKKGASIGARYKFGK